MHSKKNYYKIGIVLAGKLFHQERREQLLILHVVCTLGMLSTGDPLNMLKRQCNKNMQLLLLHVVCTLGMISTGGPLNMIKRQCHKIMLTLHVVCTLGMLSTGGPFKHVKETVSQEYAAA